MLDVGLLGEEDEDEEELDEDTAELLSRDPEAMFDLWTLKSLQGRYGYDVSPRESVHADVPDDEKDFEAYVLQFPIDDAIAECFAFTSDSDSSRQGSKFVSGGKRPPMAKNHKLKKKLGLKAHDEPLISDEEVRSSDSKRSKKGGGVFGKRHKWRTAKKTVNFTDQSEAGQIDDSSISDARLEMARFYANALPGPSPTGDAKAQHRTDNLYVNQQHIELSPLRQEAPYVPDRRSQEDDFSAIISTDQTTMARNLNDLTPEVATRLRDHHGNTLLHRSVLDGNAMAVKVILERYPDMGSDINNDKMTSVEVASKTGELLCLKAMLERHVNCKALGSALLNRLLNICAQYNQATCLDLLLSYLPRERGTCRTLPGDARGNTAAHIAAKNGNLHCLHTLVRAGYDVSSENMIGQLPLHLANHNRRQECYEYLMVMNICEGLLRNIHSDSLSTSEQVPSNYSSGIKATLEQIRSNLQRFQNLFANTRRSLSESKDSILDTLTTVHSAVQRLVKSSTGNQAQDAQVKLDELNGEIERLQDTFEFSPLSDLDKALTRLFVGLDDVISGDAIPSPEPGKIRIDPSSEEKIKTTLCTILKTVHHEMDQENFDSTRHIREILANMNSGDSAVLSAHLNDAGNLRPVAEEKFASRGRGDTLTSFDMSPADGCNGYGTVENGSSAIRTGPLVQNKHLQNQSRIPRDSENSGNSNSQQQSLSASNLSVRKTGPGPEAVKANVIPKPRTSILSKVTPRKNIGTNSNVENTSEKLDNGANSGLSLSLSSSAQRDRMSHIPPSERIDLLISGSNGGLTSGASFVSSYNVSDSESETVVSLDEESNNSETVSSVVYTTTLTSITSGTLSGMTSDMSSEVTSRIGTSSGDSAQTGLQGQSTSNGSNSFWWDPATEVRDKYEQYFRGLSPDSEDSIKLNLENERFTDDELRKERLHNHLKSVERIRSRSSQFTERITTSSGETLGGLASSSSSCSSARRKNKIVVDVSGALQARQSKKSNKKHKIKLFDLEDMADTKEMSVARFLESYDRSRDPDVTPLSARWEDMHFSAEEEGLNEEENGKPWYEMSDDDMSFVPSLRSEEGEDTDESRTICSV